MTDERGRLIIGKLVDMLGESIILCTAYKAVMEAHVGHAWADEVIASQKTIQENLGATFQKLRSELLPSVGGTPDEVPPSWEKEVERLIRSVTDDPPDRTDGGKVG